MSRNLAGTGIPTDFGRSHELKAQLLLSRKRDLALVGYLLWVDDVQFGAL